MEKKIERYQDNVEKDNLKLAKDFYQFQQENIEALKKFLWQKVDDESTFLLLFEWYFDIDYDLMFHITMVFSWIKSESRNKSKKSQS